MKNTQEKLRETQTLKKIHTIEWLANLVIGYINY